MADQTKDSIEIAASPDEVMAVIADVASYPEWVSAMKQVDVVTTHPDGKPDHVKIKLEHSVVSDHYTLAYTLARRLGELEPGRGAAAQGDGRVVRAERRRPRAPR